MSGHEVLAEIAALLVLLSLAATALIAIGFRFLLSFFPRVLVGAQLIVELLSLPARISRLSVINLRLDSALVCDSP